MKKSTLSMLLAAAFTMLLLPAAAQVHVKKKITNLKGCAYAGTLPNGVQVDLDALPGDEAKLYLDTIFMVGLHPEGTVILRAADSVKNAIATEIDGQRYILYNPEFLRQFKQGGDARWKAYSVLAHEVGHHVSNHNFKETSCKVRSKMEQEADTYSGKVLRGLCSTREQSLAALTSLPSGQPTGTCYPSINLRKKFVGQAWSDQDSIYKRSPDRDPCVDKVTNVQLTYVVKESIKETNPWAHVYDNRVEFTLDVPQASKRDRVFTHIVVDEKAGELLKIKNFVWKDFPPFTAGPKKLVWYYKKDGLNRSDVENLDMLNICSFDKNPAPTRKKELFAWGAMTAAGAGVLTWSTIRFLESQDLYHTYKQYKNPNAEVYHQPGAYSRSTTKSTADKKLNQAAIGGIVGGALFTFGLNKLCKRLQRNHRTFILIPNYPGNL